MFLFSVQKHVRDKGRTSGKKQAKRLLSTRLQNLYTVSHEPRPEAEFAAQPERATDRRVEGTVVAGVGDHSKAAKADRTPAANGGTTSGRDRAFEADREASGDAVCAAALGGAAETSRTQSGARQICSSRTAQSFEDQRDEGSQTARLPSVWKQVASG